MKGITGIPLTNEEIEFVQFPYDKDKGNGVKELDFGAMAQELINSPTDINDNLSISMRACFVGGKK